jgi:hypothetical protein
MVKRARGTRANRAKRALRTVVAALGVLWGLYLLAMNVFIRTRLFRKVIGSEPASLLVDYASAYSFVPGRIVVRDLHIRGRDSHVEWILVIDRCEFQVSFGDMLHRRFRADDVHGDGLSLRIRLRQPAFTAEHMSALPPVPGFSDPPYSGVKPPPLSDADYNLWTISLEGVVAEHVREIWIDTTRLSGDFDVRGRWYFKPVRWLDIGPATIDALRRRGVRRRYAPEQFFAEDGTVRPWTDVFALALVLVELLVGDEAMPGAHASALGAPGGSIRRRGRVLARARAIPLGRARCGLAPPARLASRASIER